MDNSERFEFTPMSQEERERSGLPDDMEWSTVKCRECGARLTRAEQEEFFNRCLGCAYFTAWSNC